MPKLLFLAGSARKHSINKKLAKRASEIASEHGAEATYIDLLDFDMPLFNEDWESENGIPETAQELAKIFADNDGYFIASPEYNSAITPLLKNTIDWMSRVKEQGKGMIAYKDKVAALGATSPGALGGLQGLKTLHGILNHVGAHVIPSQVAVGKGFDAFDGKGNLKDERTAKFLTNTIKQLVDTAEKLKS